MSPNRSGFDPSICHENDGRKHIVNRLSHYRARKNQLAGIVLQEYSVKACRLPGQRQRIFKGTSLGPTEAVLPWPATLN